MNAPERPEGSEPDKTPATQPEKGLFEPPAAQERESRSILPWAVAGAAVVIAVGLFLVLGHGRKPTATARATSGAGASPGGLNPGKAGLAALDPYAGQLAISGLKMSQAGNMMGGQTTYIDGQIANLGQRTVSGITVQVVFGGFSGEIVQKTTLPLDLIRAREPYVDTEPVSADPIEPGQTRSFRLIVDSVTQDWNQNYPEIRISQVTGSPAGK
jgi:hypothetical protein